jgi:hypothetical protein
MISGLDGPSPYPVSLTAGSLRSWQVIWYSHLRPGLCPCSRICSRRNQGPQAEIPEGISIPGGAEKDKFVLQKEPPAAAPKAAADMRQDPTSMTIGSSRENQLGNRFKAFHSASNARSWPRSKSDRYSSMNLPLMSLDLIASRR